MNDFERRLSDSLKAASESYRPSDAYAAKERFLQRARRRRLVFYSAGAALAGAAIAVTVFLASGRVVAPLPEPLPPAADVEQSQPIAVGDRPSGIAFGDDAVWVANAGDGTVMVVDPVLREVTHTIEVGGDPDDVAVGVGAAWVSDSGAGTVTSVSLPSAEVRFDPVDIPVGEPGSTHMDVAPGADGLWIAKDDSLFRVDPMSHEVQPVDSVAGPTDVAVGEGSVYVLGTTELARVDPVTLEYEVLADVAESRNQDIAFRNGFVWIANGDAGEVTRFDVERKESSDPIFVGGSFSGLAVDEESVWAISGGTGDTGVLTRIDPDTLTVVEPRAELHGRPYDITTGAGALWVANLSDDTVSGIDPDSLGSDGGVEEERDLVAVFGADGDIWAETFDGDLIALVETPEEERHPTLSPDGSVIAFERGPDFKLQTEIVVRALDSGDESNLGKGWSPAFAPDGRLAWVRPKENGDVQIAIGQPDEEPITFDAIAGYGPPNHAEDIAWDLDGTYVYYSAGWEGSSLYQADSSGKADPFELIPGNHRKFAQYLVPSVRSKLSVHVLRVCCQEPGDVEQVETTVELGIIHFTEGGPEYEAVAELARIPVESEGRGPLALDSAGNLALEGTGASREWRHTVLRSWFVSVIHGQILLVDAKGRVTDVTAAIGEGERGFEHIQGIETAPAFDD